MFYVFKLENESFIYQGRNNKNSRPRGNYLSIYSPDDFKAPQYDGENISEDEDKKASKELKEQKLKDAKEYMKAIDNHIDAASTIKQLKEVMKKIVRLLE